MIYLGNSVCLALPRPGSQMVRWKSWVVSSPVGLNSCGRLAHHGTRMMLVLVLVHVAQVCKWKKSCKFMAENAVGINYNE